MNWVQLAIVTWLVLGILGTILSVGKSVEIDATYAAARFIVNTCIIVGVLSLA